jgi:hypothetical protein
VELAAVVDEHGVDPWFELPSRRNLHSPLRETRRQLHIPDP